MKKSPNASVWQDKSNTKEAQKPNAYLKNHEILEFCRLAKKDQEYLENWLKQKNISARSFHRLLKVALTIADLENAPKIEEIHLKEAMSYRVFDKTPSF